MRDNSIRGKILEFLKDIYPEGADERTIVSVFYDYHRVDDINKALEYLADKNYIIRKEIPHPYKKNEFLKLYRITPSGIDLMDGLVKDTGVAVVPEEE
jgi:hypothetical protein